MLKKKKKNNFQANECILYVQGMHCSSCEILIEKKLLQREGVETADVSLKKNEIRVSLKNQSKLDLVDLNNEFAEMGYRFSNTPFKKVVSALFYKKADGRWGINQDKSRMVFKSLLIAILFLGVFYVVEKLQLGQYISVDATSAWPAFFFLGMVAGVSSCAALVGGLLLSMTKNWHELYITEKDSKTRAKPHWLFHGGRLISFFILGGILGIIGDKISLNNTTVYAILVIVISSVMLLLALQMLGVGWANKFSFRLPKFLTRQVARGDSWQGKYLPAGIGALTFFLPCGFTLVAQGIALTTGSFWSGAMIMLFFALGTLPMLLSISLTGLQLTKKPHLTAKFSQVAGIIIIFFALYNINGQFNVLGFKSLSDLRKIEARDIFFDRPKLSATVNDQGEEVFIFGQKANNPALPTSQAGLQELKITAQGFSYTPVSATTLPAGVPTRLIVDNQGILGCGAYLAANGLLRGFVDLKPGENVIDLGKPKKGTYKITCSMGMVAPITVTFK